MRGVTGRRRKQLLVTLRKGEGTAVLKSSHQTVFTEGARCGRDYDSVVRQTKL